VVIISSGAPVDVTGSAPNVVLDAPGGSLTGNFGDVTNSGGQHHRGERQAGSPGGQRLRPSRVLPPETSANASASMAMESDNVAFSISDDERRGNTSCPQRRSRPPKSWSSVSASSWTCRRATCAEPESNKCTPHRLSA
jgi:hypothetical protein